MSRGLFWRLLLLAGVVAVAGLDGVLLLLVGVFEAKIDLVVTVGGCVLGRGVAEAVLGSELGGDLGIDLVYGVLFGDFEETSAGFGGHALEGLLAVGVLAATAAGATLASSTTTAAGVSTASAGVASSTSGVSAASARIASASAAVVAAVVVGLVVFTFEVDGVDDGVGALGGFDGAGEGFFAAAIDAVGEEDKSFAAFLLGHDLVCGEEGGVVEGGATAPGAASAVGVVGVGLVGGAGAVDVADGGLEQGAGGGEVLEQLDGAGELDDEGLVGVAIGRGGEHGVEEGGAGGALLV